MHSAVDQRVIRPACRARRLHVRWCTGSQTTLAACSPSPGIGSASTPCRVLLTAVREALQTHADILRAHNAGTVAVPLSWSYGQPVPSPDQPAARPPPRPPYRPPTPRRRHSGTGGAILRHNEISAVRHFVDDALEPLLREAPGTVDLPPLSSAGSLRRAIPGFGPATRCSREHGAPAGGTRAGTHRTCRSTTA